MSQKLKKWANLTIQDFQKYFNPQACVYRLRLSPALSHTLRGSPPQLHTAHPPLRTQENGLIHLLIHSLSPVQKTLSRVNEGHAPKLRLGNRVCQWQVGGYRREHRRTSQQ
jgi:hypothetical protein